MLPHCTHNKKLDICNLSLHANYSTIYYRLLLHCWQDNTSRSPKITSNNATQFKQDAINIVGCLLLRVAWGLLIRLAPRQFAVRRYGPTSTIRELI